MWKRQRVLAVALLVCGVVLAGALSGCAAVTRWLANRKAHQPPYRVVSPPVAYEIVRDTPDVFILDLRGPEEFQGPKGHLRNALDIPLGRLPYQLLQLRAYRGETFLVYCGNEDCGHAGMRILKDSGFEDAILIAGGIDGWIRAGFLTFVRASLLRPPNAQIKLQRHPELVPEAYQPMDEVPVEPPREPDGPGAPAITPPAPPASGPAPAPGMPAPAATPPSAVPAPPAATPPPAAPPAATPPSAATPPPAASLP